MSATLPKKGPLTTSPYSRFVLLEQDVTCSINPAHLKLAEVVDLTVYTPACLPQPDDDYTGQMGNVYGESEKLVLSPASWTN